MRRDNILNRPTSQDKHRIHREKIGCETFPKWRQSSRLHPFSETVFDGHTCSSLSFLPVSQGSRGSGGGGDVAPSPRKFVACIRHGLKNTRVALAELATAPRSSVCCSNSSGGR